MPPKQNEDGNEGGNDQLEGLTKIFGDMSKQLSELPKQVNQAVVSGIQETISAAEEQRRAAAEQSSKPSKKERESVNEEDLEGMSRSQFMQHIIEQISDVVDEAVAPLKDGLSATVESTQREKVAEKFEKARSQFKDFDEWKEEMAKLVEQHGYLDPDELYTLARSKNPEKAKQIDEKLAEEQKEQEEEQKGKGKESPDEDKPTFLGLMPTSGGEKSEGEQTFKSTKDAASAAFDEILGNVPEELMGEQHQA